MLLSPAQQSNSLNSNCVALGFLDTYRMMTECDPLSGLDPEEIDALFADRTVNGVLLDRSGAIVHVSRGWKTFAQESGLALANYGIGQNYLRHCAYADEESSRIVEGIAQLLAGRIDFLSFVYPCHSPTAAPRWFLLLGFPYVKGNLTALVHIDITGFMPPLAENREPVVVTDLLGAELMNALVARKGSVQDLPARLPVELDAARVRGGGRSEASAPALSKRQSEVLELIAKGMSNVEIARALAISPNTVKIHVSGILARLGLPSRTQAIHWMLTRAQENPAADAGS
jgi:DNA-binding CsgD family transcriptional regulator